MAILITFDHPMNMTKGGSIPTVGSKWAIDGLFFVYFWSFSCKHYNFYSKFKVKKCPSSIRC